MTTMTRTWGVHTRSINDRHLATINSGDHVEMFRSRLSAGFYTSRRSSRANDECKSTTNVISASRSEISRHLLEMIFMPLLSVQHVSVTMFFFVARMSVTISCVLLSAGVPPAGIEREHIFATVKHFCSRSRESPVSRLCNQQALRESSSCYQALGNCSAGNLPAGRFGND